MRSVVNLSILAIMSIAMTCCFGNKPKNEDDKPSEKRLSMKSAYIIYEKVENGILSETTHVMWENYGKFYRIGEDNNYTILDEKKGKMFLNDHGDFVELSESFYSMGIMGRNGSGYYENKSAPEYTKLPLNNK